MMKNSLSIDVTTREITVNEPAFVEIHEIQEENEKFLTRYNTAENSREEKNELLGKIIGESVDDSITVLAPFYTDFGRHIKFGKDIYVNRGVMFTDLGGIVIEDHVLIGPGARLLTVNHPVSPTRRRGLICKPIILKENAWIGAGATVLQGITIGKNSIVSANATVTRDVPDNVIVAGTPAKIIKEIVED